MVATRNHPRDFPAPTDSPTKSPTKRTTRSSTADAESERDIKAEKGTSSPLPVRVSSLIAPAQSAPGAWSHTPSNLTLLWLLISLPLVLWDTGYVLLRPYTLPGGSLHSPIWSPYKLYGTIDYVYSPQAYHENLGFTAAQASVNVIETAMYLVYAWVVYTYGVPEHRQGTGAPDVREVGWIGERRTVRGREAVWAVLLGYTTFVLTFSKTVLYMFNEAATGFSGIRHNDPITLLFCWIIPNGAWIILPCYLGYVFGAEIIQGLEVAAGIGSKEE